MGAANRYIFLILALLCIACSQTSQVKGPVGPIDSQQLPKPDIELTVAGMSNCTQLTDHELKLNSALPIVVLVHGCRGSAGKFRALAEVFAFHGQQTICFNYDDRDSLDLSAKKLRFSLNELRVKTDIHQTTLIGHSQGGLIARRALTDKQTFGEVVEVKLVTISSPFAGILAADHCGSKLATILTLGLNRLICYAATGDKWDEIHQNAEFIKSPGELNTQVVEYLKVVTDEEGSCRTRDPRGECIEDDFVFSLGEQYSEAVDSYTGVEKVKVRAGHVEIVGDETRVPDKLISILQTRGLMAVTESDDKAKLISFLNELY